MSQVVPRLEFERARRCLNAQDFTRLFLEELGWDRLAGRLSVSVGEGSVALEPVAQKRGLAVWRCPAIEGAVPEVGVRRRISREVRQSHHEHLLIFAGRPDEPQRWQWVKHRPGRPAQARELTWYPGTPGALFLQRLERLAVALHEEDGLGLIDVTGRVRDAFDVSGLTRQFYDAFAKQRDAFAAFLTGLDEAGPRAHYVSVIINRLMFIWFVQQKGFLNADRDYLQTLLAESQARGPDRFYRHVLRPLFFAGFAVPKAARDAATVALLGDIPYLSGSIFTPHPLEAAAGDALDLPDAAFVQLFAFFAKYTWHLDDRPVAHNDEINPDVLGHIFEKYINQQQMGAYYTQEDITGYITQNALLPWLLDAATRRCEVAFRGPASVWQYLADDPDRYLYPSLLHGLAAPLPDTIAAGLDDLTQRAGWNDPAPATHALPTEIWREVIARRARVAELRETLASGAVRDANTLITLNLNLRQFVQDIVSGWDGPDLLDAFWEALEAVTVLDPTCGSGAFLFAALNLLEPLYEACLDHLEDWLPAGPEPAGGPPPSPYVRRFRELLAQVGQHPNRAYFIIKSIIVNNLFGVDLMPEAVEICHLRLFLKLISAIDSPDQIEPLPDIDFNIQPGNTLVGFATQTEVDLALVGQGGQMPLVLLPEDEDLLARLHATAERAQDQAKRYRELQTTLGVEATVFSAARAALRETLATLNDELHRYLALQYDVDAAADPAGYAAWLAGHQPFHWFVEFYEIMKGGGFDVIVGNPPYVARRKIGYRLLHPVSNKFRDIYADVSCRAVAMTRPHGRYGLIIPLSVTFADHYEPLRETFGAAGAVWYASFDNRPSALFDGVDQRCTIVVGAPGQPGGRHAAPMVRWAAAFREHLTAGITYREPPPALADIRDVAKVADPALADLMSALDWTHPAPPDRRRPAPGEGLGYSTAARNFISAFIDSEPPCLASATFEPLPTSKISWIRPLDPLDPPTALACLTTRSYLLYWLIRGDGFDVTKWIVHEFLQPLAALDGATLGLLRRLGVALHERRNEALVFQLNAGKYVGNYDYRRLSHLTDRADLVLLAGLGLTRAHAETVFDTTDRLRALSEVAHRTLPPELHALYPPAPVDGAAEAALLGEVDTVIGERLGLSRGEVAALGGGG